VLAERRYGKRNARKRREKRRGNVLVTCWPTDAAPLVTVDSAPPAPLVTVEKTPPAPATKNRNQSWQYTRKGEDRSLQVASEKMEPPKEVTSPNTDVAPMSEVRSLRTGEEADVRY
jgi:hypothetical protein